MIIWITGRAGAGKTTLAYHIKRAFAMDGDTALVIDGDIMRELVPNDFSDEGRVANIKLATRLATMVEVQGITPIVAMISPKAKWRKWALSGFKKSLLYYVEGGTLWEGTEYEPPTEDEPHIVYNWREE